MACRVTLIGFGEAAASFAGSDGWRAAATAFDIDPARAVAAVDAGVAWAKDAQSAVRDARLILSLVTADQALTAAQDCAPYLAEGAVWCDMNSVAPGTKRTAAQLIEANGGRYVDVAVLAPVYPARLAVPLLLAGKDAEAVQPRLAAIGFDNIRVVGQQVGRASTIKLIRSVMVKGIEALTDEMMAAAMAADVVDEVLASLDASESPARWSERAVYNLERMTRHGLRRAAEMEESARTLESLGIEPVMTIGTVKRQRNAATRRSDTKDAA